MASVNDSELIKALKSENYSPVYYFYGKDILTVGNYAKRLSEKLVSPENSAYNLHKFDGRKLDLSILSDTLEALPMFAEYVCVLVNDINAEELPADDLNYLIKLVGEVSDGTVLIFYNTGIDICGGKKFPTSKNKKLIDAVSKKGTVCEFAFKTARELSKSIISAVSQRKSIISKENAEYLAELCLSDTMMINGEVAKLTSYVGEGEITRSAIDSLVSRQLDSNAFDLAKAVVRFDVKSALSLLDELFYQRAEPVSVLSAISMSMLDLYRAKLAIVHGVSSAEVCENFGYKANRKFAVDNAFRDARKTSESHLRFCMKTLADTDRSLKSSRIDGRLAIEKAIVEMTSHR